MAFLSRPHEFTEIIGYNLCFLAGVVILFVSVVRERIFTHKKDKDAKEVKK